MKHIISKKFGTHDAKEAKAMFEEHKKNCDLHCVLEKWNGEFGVQCFAKDVEDHKKKVRKDIIDEIDTNDNGRITKKEIKAFINKDKNK